VAVAVDIGMEALISFVILVLVVLVVLVVVVAFASRIAKRKL
jgi:hypothetical protein